jgi:hypothetical protein
MESSRVKLLVATITFTVVAAAGPVTNVTGYKKSSIVQQAEIAPN